MHLRRREAADAGERVPAEERREVVLDCVCTVAGKPVVEAEVLVMAPKRPPERAA